LRRSRNSIAMTALLLSGVIAGAAIGAIAARDLRLKIGKSELTRYAERILRSEDNLSRELHASILAVLHDNLSLCSDQELLFMRRMLFSTAYVKDIGRIQEDQLVCAASVGRIVPPQPIHFPDISFPAWYLAGGDGQVYLHTPLPIDPGGRGIVFRYRDIDVVVNPNAAAPNEPPMKASALVFVHANGEMLQVYGEPDPLSGAEITAQRMIERDGVLYQPLCSKVYQLCAIASEPRAAMVAANRGSSPLLVISAGITGGLFAQTLILFYQRQRTLDRRLRRAIRRGHLWVAYQPVVDLRSRAIVGAEALARWSNDPEGEIPTELFISVAEAKGFIGEITRFVIKRVVKDMGGLLHQNEFTVTVNIASHDLCDPGFFTFLEQIVKETRVNPAALGFELTERSAADREIATAAIARLKSSGHPVYIDDFGTGYSSLSYLHELNADVIKIDRAFTKTVGTEAVTASVVPQILDMAKQLNLAVVVEGIETAEQAEYFSQAGEGIRGQGWHLGRPAPPAQFKRLFHAGGRPAL